MRDTLRDEVDLALIGIYMGKDFNPSQPRDPHTGEWIGDGVPDLPSMDLQTGVAEQFGEVVNALATRHRWPSADKPLPIKIVRTRQRRGRQTSHVPAGELAFKGQVPSAIRLRARDDMPGETQSVKESDNAFAHEAGHYLDWQLLGEPSGAVEGNQVLSSAVGERPTPAMSHFMDVALNTATMKKWLETTGHEGTDDYHSYMASPSEVWARAYAQWVLGTVPSGWVAENYAWPKGEFAKLEKALEGVLREAGLL